MINGMTDEQNKFLLSEGKVIIKACPGSGKTYTVAHKLLSYIDNWTEYHSGIAVLSFTNVASDEIYKKAKSINDSIGISQYPHFIGTVDSFINEFIVLRYGHLYMVDNVRPRIAMEDSWKLPNQWREECHKRCKNEMDKFYYGIDGRFYKGNKVVPCAKQNDRLLPCQRYKNKMLRKGIIFQNETAWFAACILRKNPIIAKAIVDRFPIIIIDEAQDMSINQMAVFDLLGNSGIRSMFLVGDPDQAIYEWRNANPECFKNKIEDPNWQTIEFTNNFRNSQNICNVTSFFSEGLKGHSRNKAIGNSKDEKEKPVLLLYNKNSEKEIIDYFLCKCNDMGIKITPQNVAILTRRTVHEDTNITDLWKSKEIKLFASAAYEWSWGSRNKAYKETFEAAYSIIFNEDLDEYDMQKNICQYTNKDTWRNYVIDILCSMPDIEIGIGEWVKTCSEKFSVISKNYGYTISTNKCIDSIFKIKQRDKGKADFKNIPLRYYFEKKTENIYTRSSIHGVKGESYDAVLLYVNKKSGNTITPKMLMYGDVENELMRLAYVAMTRPRRLLMLALPETKGIEKCDRFSEELWNYKMMNKI